MNGLQRFVDGGARSEAPDPQQPPVSTDVGVDPEDLPAPLKRFLQPRPTPPPGERCEFCGVDVPEHDHRHVVDLEGRGMMCSCRGCALLFTEAGAAGGQYRTVPEDTYRVEDFRLTSEAWAALRIPVGMTFVIRNTVVDRMVAFYPSPGGATESELSLEAWDDIVADNPALAALEPDVEACLIRARFGAGSPAMVALLGDDLDGPECYVVPVDRCYELVGLLRLHWRGFDGGQEVREAVRDFFAEVRRRSRELEVSRAPATAGGDA